MIEKTCEYCGSIFHRPPSSLKLSPIRYCSVTCRKAATVAKNAAPLTAEEVRSLFRLCPETKVLYWRKSPTSGPAKSGEQAGYLDRSKNRWAITIRGTEYWVSRVIWLYEHGEWPTGQVDHIDGDPSDNRKIREVTNSQNQRNAKRRSDNTSGHKGVSWSKVCKKWHAYIYVEGKLKNLGYFHDINDAISVREKTAVQLFGEYVREE
jgi:hypothetical protein